MSTLADGSIRQGSNMNSDLQCAHCHELAQDIRRARLPVVTFLGVAIIWKTDLVEACTCCMRKLIVHRTLASILTANLIWPIVAVALGLEYMKTYQQTPDRNTPRPARKKMPDWLLVVLVLAAIAVVFLILFGLHLAIGTAE
jgi:hypothetical protein